MDDDGGVGILPPEEPSTPEPVVDEPADEPARPDVPDIEVGAAAEETEEPGNAMALDEPAADTQILVLKTQVGQERRVIEMMGNKARRFGIPIQAILSPQELRGYVFIETTDVLALQKGIRGVSYARALVTTKQELRDENGEVIKDRRGRVVTELLPVDTPFSEIAHFLTPVSAVAKIGEADIVELVSGPFRGEKAKVTKVDDAREELTVELIDSMVPIPITVRGDHVRVLERADGSAVES